MDVFDLLEQVTDQESFFAFVQALIDDREAALVENEKERALHPQTYMCGAPLDWQN
jgi:hypothetical protein